MAGLSSVAVDAAGTGYEAKTTTVVLTGGGGTGAVAHVVVATNGRIDRVDVFKAGTGYTTPPTVSFTSTTGSGARATASVG